MLSHNSGPIEDSSIEPKDSKVQKLVDIAKTYFHQGEYELAISNYKEAIKACVLGSLDQAICFYRLGTTILNDKSTKRDYNTQREYKKSSYNNLEKALKLFEEHALTNKDNKLIILQIQKSLAYLAKCALEMKDGNKLAENTNKLLSSVKLNANDNFELDCYRYLYQIYLAQNDLGKAKEYLTKAMKMKDTNHDTELKHELKMKFINAINLIKTNPKLAKSEIEKISTSYYKNVLGKNIKAYKGKKEGYLKVLIIKDLVFMLKMQLLISASTYAFNSVMSIAKEIFKPLPDNLEKDLNKSLEKFRNGEKVYLAFSLFKEKEPPYFTNQDVILLYEKELNLEKNTQSTNLEQTFETKDEKPQLAKNQLTIAKQNVFAEANKSTHKKENVERSEGNLKEKKTL